MPTNAFTFFASYFNAMQELSDAQAGKLIKAMSDYSLNGVEPEFTDSKLRLCWVLMLPNMDASTERKINASKGGQNGAGVSRNSGNDNAQKDKTKATAKPAPKTKNNSALLNSKSQNNSALLNSENKNNSNKDKDKDKDKEKEKKEEKEKEEEKKNLHQLAREDEKVFSSSLASPETFQPPTEEEVRRHCEANAYTFKPEKFFSYYESRQWMIGPRKMASWQSVARTWQLEEEERNNKLKQQQNVRNERPYISDAQRAKAARDAEFAAYAQRLLNTPDEKPELPF